MADQPQGRPPSLQTFLAARVLAGLLVALVAVLGVAPQWAAWAGGTPGLSASIEGAVQGLTHGAVPLLSLPKASPRSIPPGPAPDVGSEPPAALPGAAPSAVSPATVGRRLWASAVLPAPGGHLTVRTPTGPPAA